MSTFKGVIAEFPHIRIDYFRHQSEHRAPLACFLSHVHSDHLTGLESLRAPFVYCSAATREILLRLEKYHYRVNFAKGILESRNVTYDRSMHKLAKPLPLDTPTVIELAPGNSIRVTLIDANHCVGAVMFLIEGDGKAVLYTGDIRAEAWWLNALIQNPVLIPYTFGNRRLDCIYLDTTFATKNELYHDFPSKAEGIRELLQQISEHPEDAIFYFNSWTFGYESVWIALSAFLGSRIHLDSYRARIYGSLSTLDKRQLKEIGLDIESDNKYLKESGLEIREAPALCGFRNGNHIQPGCLTSREGVRIHSCERGMGCRVMDNDVNAKVVHIVPIITRSNGLIIAELGAGGGKGDLDQKEELETGDITNVGKLMELCAKTIKDETLLSKVLAVLQQTLENEAGTLDLEMQIQKGAENGEDELSLQSLMSALSSNATKNPVVQQPRNPTIYFPYSRHSSYTELCELVAAFKPNDVYPCTVDEDNWTPEMSIQSLFGEFCSNTTFRHDAEKMPLYNFKIRQAEREKRDRDESQQDTQTTDDQPYHSPPANHNVNEDDSEFKQLSQGNFDLDQTTTAIDPPAGTKDKPITIEDLAVPKTSQHNLPSVKNNTISIPQSTQPTTSMKEAVPPLPSSASTTLPPRLPSSSTTPHTHKRRKKMTNKQIAYDAAIGAQLTWAEYGGLQCTRRSADRDEEEL